MFILGSTFLGVDFSFSPTPTDIQDINHLELSNGVFKNLYASKNTDISIDDYIPLSWDINTIILANKYTSGNINAGSVSYSLSNISSLLIKRRKVGDFDWVTIYCKETNTEDDLLINGIDYTNSSDVEYEYAVTPVINYTEGEYSTTTVYSVFDGIYLIDNEDMYGTELNTGYIDTTRNKPCSIQVLPNYKYPRYYSFGNTNYDTGSAQGLFAEFDPQTCEFLFDDAHLSSYQSKVIDFLTNGKPKLLKNYDGRSWLVVVSDNPTNTAEGYYQNRNITFNWTQIGEADSEKDLYECGIIDVPSTYWSKQY